MVKVVVDSRERALLSVFKERADGYEVKALPVGDISVEYENGTCWLCERKTATDLAASLTDGRWIYQMNRMMLSERIVFVIIEGDLGRVGRMYNSALGAWLSTAMRDVHVLRSWDINETFRVLIWLINKLEHRASTCNSLTGNRLEAPKLGGGLVSKREYDAAHVEVRQLMCIPSISERIARVLLQHFGNITNLRHALSDMQSFPTVQLSGKKKLGKSRLRILFHHLVDNGVDRST